MKSELICICSYVYVILIICCMCISKLSFLYINLHKIMCKYVRNLHSFTFATHTSLYVLFFKQERKSLKDISILHYLLQKVQMYVCNTKKDLRVKPTSRYTDRFRIIPLIDLSFSVLVSIDKPQFLRYFLEKFGALTCFAPEINSV